VDFGLVSLTPEQEAFAAEARAFLDRVVTEDVHRHERDTGDGFNAGVHLALGSRGWLMPEWPAADGGAGLDRVSCLILAGELSRHRVPGVTAGTTRAVWKAVDQFAEPALRDELKGGVANGTIRFCLGYTEPDGGSDIAGARLRAVNEGGEWLLNGSKMFTTGAQNCQYTFLLTRTDPGQPKHRGLTMFLVPLDAPGISIQGIRTFGGERSNLVYYDNVRISDRYRLGRVNDGWSVLSGPLSEEHSLGERDGLGDLSAIGRGFLRDLEPALDAAVAWAATPGPDGRRPADDPTVLMRLGRIATDLEAGICTPGPEGRVKGSAVLIQAAADLVDLMGPLGVLRHGSEGAPGDGVFDYAHRFAQGTATYAGTVEVFRNIIAQQVLGLPRPVYPGSRQFLSNGKKPIQGMPNEPLLRPLRP